MSDAWTNAIARARAHAPFLALALDRQPALEELLAAGSGEEALAWAKAAGAGAANVASALRRERLGLAAALAIGDLAGAFSLERVMGERNEKLNLATKPPAVILLAGLQGAGKTTSAAKLARYLKEKEKRSVMLVSADVYRPAAIKQLETLAHEVGVSFFPSSADQQPVAIARAAIDAARIKFNDVVIVDTAGRVEKFRQKFGSVGSKTSVANG